MTRIRLAVVGSGGMANHRADKLSAHHGFEVAAVAARNPETGRNLARRLGIELVDDWRILINRDDIAGIVICTHNEIHGKIALEALAAGKHVFSEYPVARYTQECVDLSAVAGGHSPVLRLTHNEPLSAMHAAVKEQCEAHGPLRHAHFLRCTPGRGGRPEVLFNLNLSGPPALFFVYHVYPLVDIFGPARWVESNAHYEGLGNDGGYNRFYNTVTAEFVAGGVALWTWAGGIEIEQAEQIQRILLDHATLIRDGRAWNRSTRSGTQPVEPAETGSRSLEDLFYDDITGTSNSWKQDLNTAIESARIGLAAERSASEQRRVLLAEL